jgi:hypothetical protein
MSSVCSKSGCKGTQFILINGPNETFKVLEIVSADGPQVRAVCFSDKVRTTLLLALLYFWRISFVSLYY